MAHETENRNQKKAKTKSILSRFARQSGTRPNRPTQPPVVQRLSVGFDLADEWSAAIGKTQKFYEDFFIRLKQ